MGPETRESSPVSTYRGWSHTPAERNNYAVLCATTTKSITVKLWRARLSTLPPRDGRSVWRAGVVLVISHAAHSEPAGGAEPRHPLQIRTRTPHLFGRRRDFGSTGMLHVVAGASLLALAAARVSARENRWAEAEKEL